MQINSALPLGIQANFDVDELEYCSIVYMCIKQAGNSEYQVPEHLRSLVDELLGKVYALKPSLYEDDWTKYCYLTVKRQYIQPHSVPNRYGWHIDGFKSDQDNFIWCDRIPTEVSVGQFDLTDDHEISLEEMQKQAQAERHFCHSLHTHTLYLLDQECVHNVTMNKLNKAVLRTFIKITFSKELFNCFGNAWNYKLPHIKPTTPRKEIRNHGTL